MGCGRATVDTVAVAVAVAVTGATQDGWDINQNATMASDTEKFT